MENWTEIKINVPVERVDEAGSIASMTVPYGIYIEDYSDMDEMVWEIAHIDLIDEDLLREEFIGCHPCVNTSSLKIKTSDILQIFLPAVGHSSYRTVRLVGVD